MMNARAVSSTFATAILVAWGTRASAGGADAAERVALRIETQDPSCPSPENFAASVTSRTRRANVVEPGQASDRRFSVTFRADPKGEKLTYIASMREDEGGESREIRGRSCAEVADALAFVLALAVDPNASRVPLPPSSDLPSSSPAPSPAPPVPVPVPVPVPPSSSSPLPSPAETPTTEPPRPLLPSLRASAETRIAATPTPLFGGALEAELSLGDRGPSARAGVLVAASSTSDAGYLLGAARLAACPFTWKPVRTLALRPACALGHVGVVRGEGKDIAHPSTETVPWLDVGGSAGLVWEAWPNIALTLDAQGLFAVTRPRFLVQTPDRVLYDEPIASLGLSAGVAVRFR